MIRSLAPSRRRRPATRARRGFSLVELIVAMLLLAIGVLGLAGVSAYAIRQSSSANIRNVAAIVAQSRMEDLRSRGCPVAGNPSPAPVTKGVTETWAPLVGTTTTRVIGNFTFSRRSGKNPVTETITDTTYVLCL